MHPKIYEEFATSKDYGDYLKAVIERRVSQLKAMDTDVSRPGMLLGKIQSGKTHAHIGIFANVFDEGYYVAIILAKFTEALAKQTVQRLSKPIDCLTCGNYKRAKRYLAYCFHESSPSLRSAACLPLLTGPGFHERVGAYSYLCTQIIDEK